MRGLCNNDCSGRTDRADWWPVIDDSCVGESPTHSDSNTTRHRVLFSTKRAASLSPARRFGVEQG